MYVTIALRNCCVPRLHVHLHYEILCNEICASKICFASFAVPLSCRIIVSWASAPISFNLPTPRTVHSRPSQHLRLYQRITQNRNISNLPITYAYLANRYRSGRRPLSVNNISANYNGGTEPMQAPVMSYF